MPTRIQSLLRKLPRLQIPLPQLQEFNLFMNLPPELRKKIIKGAAYEPRLIPLHIFLPYEISDAPYEEELEGEMPSILCVSKEFNYEGLKHYQLVTQRALKCLYPALQYASRTVYLNFESDRFVIYEKGNLVPGLGFPVDALQKVQNLVILHNGYLPQGLNADFLQLRDLLQQLPKVRQMQLIINNWCAQVGVTQGVGQELYKKELTKDFEAYFSGKLKDCERAAELKFNFADWNDLDTPPCSAVAAMQGRFRYFTARFNRFYR